MVLIVDVECLKKCLAKVKVGFNLKVDSKSHKGIGKCVSQIEVKTSGKFIKPGSGK